MYLLLVFDSVSIKLSRQVHVNPTLVSFVSKVGFGVKCAPADAALVAGLGPADEG